MQRPFITGSLAEISLLLVALLCGYFFRTPPFATCRCEVGALLLGVTTVIPLFLFFVYTLHSRFGFFARHERLLESVLRPLMGNWSVPQMAFISLIAGVCEEALFRGFLQGALAVRTGKVPALIVASVLFGLAHPLSRTYILIASVLGVYLGLLWNWTGNLLTPITTHTVYDFLALLYFLKLRQPLHLG
jgi:uncharacterized protein